MGTAVAVRVMRGAQHALAVGLHAMPAYLALVSS